MKFRVKNPYKNDTDKHGLRFFWKKGDYIEEDFPDPKDFYGRSKFLGELVDERMLTLRTSTIGHEIGTKFGLLEWFLSQKNQCKGFNKAIFSGLTTIELTRVMRNMFYQTILFVV